MRDYLTFESEFDRLKDYFLLEGVGNDDDLEEGSNDEDSSSKSEDKEEPSEKTEDTESTEETDTEDNGDGDDQDALSDLDGDSDLDDLTGNPGDAPSEEDVNKEDGAPGAINPENLIKELTEGEDNIYTRVGKAMAEQFPGQPTVKEIEEPLRKSVAHAVKAYMKNKNYAPLTKEAMKGVCDKLADMVLRKAVKSAKDKKNGNGKKQQGNVANEAIYFVKKAPVFESEELLESFWKNAAAAAAIGLAGANAAHSATAESAPDATKMGTPAYTRLVDQANKTAEQKKGDVQKTNKQASSSSVQSSSSTVPQTSNPGSVVFNKDSTYNLTPDDYVTFKLANNLPAHYIVTGGSEKAPASSNAKATTGKAGVQKKGTGSASQSAVKTDTKASVNKGNSKPSSSSAERCVAPQEEKSESWGQKFHRWAHKAVDKGGEIGAGVIGGAVGAAKGLYNGANAGYSKAKEEIEKDHDEMIKERGHH
jgi:hypothetical protein